LRRAPDFRIAATSGAGRTALLRAIFRPSIRSQRPGHREAVSRGGFTVVESRRGRLGGLDEGPQSEGLASNRAWAHKLTYSWLQPYSRFGILDDRQNDGRQRMARQVERALRDAGQAVGELRRRHQQKVRAWKMLQAKPDVLLPGRSRRARRCASKAEIFGSLANWPRAESNADGEQLLARSCWESAIRWR